MDNQQDSLLESLKQYETQLSQINQAIDSPSVSSNKQDLYTLRKDIEELIGLTKETLSTLKKPSVDISTNDDVQKDVFSDEYALFKSIKEGEAEERDGELATKTSSIFKKAELAELESTTEEENTNPPDTESRENSILEGLQEELDALKGSKCQAPQKQNWGDHSYHNALIVDIEAEENVQDMNHIQLRVLFVNPTERRMLPCPYYLDGECRFADDKCHFSHGAVVPLSAIREYREPDFSSVKEGSQVLAKQKDKLWHRAKVKNILDNNKCLVQFESKGCESLELDLHDLLPLEGEGQGGEESNDSLSSTTDSDSSDSENTAVVPQEHFVQLSLLRNPPNSVLGAWEKHTKGIGSRLMANMGYIVGCGLGKYGEGRLEPVEATAYPPGKSLDACMALREEAGGDQDMFKAEKRQRKQQNQLLRMQQRQQERQAQRKDLFSFLNTKLSGPTTHATPSTSSQVTLASSSRKGLNVERFRLDENIKKVQKDIVKFKQSLQRQEKGSVVHNAINSKLEEAQLELNKLQNSDMLIAKEQTQRDVNKKMAVF